MPTITIPIEDLVFVLAALVGGGLLLITVLLDDVLGGLLDALHIDFSIGGVSLMPPLLAFIAMFGVGGIFATQVLDLHGGAAAAVGVGFGLVGFAVAYLLFRALRRAEGARPFSVGDLVGHTGSVSVAIPAGRLGTVYVRAEGQNHELSATAAEDIPQRHGREGRRDGGHGPRRRAHDAPAHRRQPEPGRHSNPRATEGRPDRCLTSSSSGAA